MSMWSDMPSEILRTIAGNLTEFTDWIRFRSVCTHWRSSSHSHSPRHPHAQPPWLLISSAASNHFYSLSEDRVYATPPPSIPANSRLFGSASGWFFSLTGRPRRLTASLINPFTGRLIELPAPLQRSSLAYLDDETLVWDCSASVVVAACRTREGVFYCRFGEAAWYPIESQQQYTVCCITFSEGKFYILHDKICETSVVDAETLEQITVIAAPVMEEAPMEARLSVSTAELLLLSRPTWTFLFPDSAMHYKVHCANLNLSDELVEWSEVKDIGPRALFVDNLRCISVEAGDASMLRRNCIYSVHPIGLKELSMKYSISVYDLGNDTSACLEGSLSQFRPVHFSRSLMHHVPSWVLPSLN